MPPHKGFAYVTLLTSESYIPGAVTLVASLRATATQYPIVCIVASESFSVYSVQLLFRTFDKVLFVPILRSNDHSNLSLLGRPELDVTFTKLHVWDPSLLVYDRIVFLDADTLVLRNVDELFDYVDEDHVNFAAAPDIGWPDCFNSGVFVTKPSTTLYSRIIEFARSYGSFDGGDQGLLNAFFSSWGQTLPVSRQTASRVNTARLPFTFNVTPSASYSYLPAFVQFGQQISIVHFIGKVKPWHWERFTDGSAWNKTGQAESYTNLVQKWLDIYDTTELGLPDAEARQELMQRLPSASSESGSATNDSTAPTTDPVPSAPPQSQPYGRYGKAPISTTPQSQSPAATPAAATQPVQPTASVGSNNYVLFNEQFPSMIPETKYPETQYPAVPAATADTPASQAAASASGQSQNPASSDFGNYRIEWNEHEFSGMNRIRRKSQSLSPESGSLKLQDFVTYVNEPRDEQKSPRS
ncbi:nucleotide-diphospho-sugar transferase [Polychytrium aggregatum]|uniref:nucleotide-diphospho-sugar transferase n=1 Tax=Polychytrium aggregatum TaxID=110093 RepID=UPI0022FEE25B|nr:nucleotide-diphospho-sugar transferase [Polychytrium aggregatum]KAI9203259.1 nucleotide-diphospho-sugar transferase [Polychytrium aggregatum]